MQKILFSRYVWSLVALCTAALCQSWFVGALLLTRRGDALLHFCIMGGVFWAWCCWAYFLWKGRVGLLLAGCCLAATLLLCMACLLDLLDITGVRLIGDVAG